MSHPRNIRKSQIEVDPEIVLCDQHKKNVNAFCTTCNEQVCSDCIVDKHNGHDIKRVRVKEIVSEKRQVLTNNINNLETITAPQIKKLLNETRRKQKQQETISNELTDIGDDRADKLVSCVNKAKEGIHEEISQFNKPNSDKLTKLKNILLEILLENEERI